MTEPFEGPDHGEAGFGFGSFEGPFDHHSRRGMHHARRDARRELKALFKDQAFARVTGGPGGFGFGASFGPGFGPGGPRGPRAGRGGPRGGRPRGGHRRGRRGDVRAAILALLTERPMHGYEMIQEIGARSDGLWQPSPGSVYPTLQLLVDEGLIVAAESEGSKRLFELTDEGRQAAAQTETPPWEEIAEGADPDVVNLRAAFKQLTVAVFQGAEAATAQQQKRIVDIVNAARRDIYGVLGDD